MRTIKSNETQKGFTLIETAISIAVVAFLIVPAIIAYNVYLKHEAVNTTQFNLTAVKDNIRYYLLQYGEYPCPAPLDAAPGTAAYGRPGNCTDVTVAPGTCANGICVENSARLVDLGAGPVSVRVRRGAIPFTALGLPEKYAVDGFGNRYIYAVTEVLTRNATFKPGYGGIDVVDAAGVSLVNPMGSAHFVILSPGPDKKGGYNVNGIQTTACAGAQSDIENCDVGTAARYMSAQYSATDGAAHFDDRISYFTYLDKPMWKASDANPRNIHDLMPPAGTAAINAATPTEKLEIAGGLRATISAPLPTGPGRVLVNDMRDKANTESVTPGLLASTDPAVATLRCPPGQYATHLADNTMRCEADVAILCPPGQYVTGIAGGAMACAPLPGPPPPGTLLCPDRTRTMCPGEPDETLAGNVPVGTISSISQGGTDDGGETWFMKDYYECFARTDGIGGWRYLGDCDSYSPESPCRCPCRASTQTFINADCPWGQTGTRDFIATTTCPGGDYTETETRNDCACAPFVFTQETDCSNPEWWQFDQGYGFPADYSGGPQWSGTIYSEYAWVCNPDGSGSTNDWQVVSDTCTCTPMTQEESWSCPAGFTGEQIVSVTYGCPDSSTFNSVVTDNCVPDTPPPPPSCPTSEVRTVPCVAPKTGNMTQNFTIACDGTATAGSIVNQSTCIDPTPPPPTGEKLCSWVTDGSPTQTDVPTPKGDSSGDSCVCLSSGVCHEQLAPGRYNNYNCTCQ